MLRLFLNRMFLINHDYSYLSLYTNIQYNLIYNSKEDFWLIQGVFGFSDFHTMMLFSVVMKSYTKSSSVYNFLYSTLKSIDHWIIAFYFVSLFFASFSFANPIQWKFWTIFLAFLATYRVQSNLQLTFQIFIQLSAY